MWRFWNNIPRAFRQHVYNPRPSAGRCAEEEQEAIEKGGCPFSGRRRASHETGDVRCCSAKVLHRLLNKRQDRDKDGHYADKNQQHDTGKDGGSEWWKSCQRDWWKMLEGTNRMLEAISVGTAMLWGSDGDKYKRKSKLLYRILFALPGSGTTIKSVNGGVIVTPSDDCTATASAQMAIKDAAGAEHDAAVNLSKTETLDSALEEFQTMCTEYTAQSESLLGLHAAQKGDMETAVKHLRSSCMLGNSSACFNLGLCYETGSGVTLNVDKAQHFYKMAVKGGNILALYNLGLMYMNGCDCSNVEASKGAAADVCGCTRAEGLNLLEKAARLGLAEAQTYLGIHHIEEEQNVAKAVSYFRAAAEQNDTEAQYFLGVCYENGWGVEVNECRAAHLYALAASAGHATATFNLAVFNEQGQGGLPEDKATAKDLYEKAAERGSEQAKERLEEIQASQAAAEVWQEKINTFHQLYQQYHKDEGFTTTHHHESTSLSPSASSPNLTEYLHKSFSYIYGDQNANWDKGYQQIFDPGGEIHSNNDKRIVFQLGHDSVYDEGSDDVSFKSSPDQSFESEMDDEEFFMSPSLRKSRTVPNFSLVMCNVCY